jgi:hypothetical protein
MSSSAAKCLQQQGLGFSRLSAEAASASEVMAASRFLTPPLSMPCFCFGHVFGHVSCLCPVQSAGTCHEEGEALGLTMSQAGLLTSLLHKL